MVIYVIYVIKWWIVTPKWSQNQTQQVMIEEKTRGVRKFVCCRIWDRAVSLVWCEGAQWFNSVGESIDCGYIGY